LAQRVAPAHQPTATPTANRRFIDDRDVDEHTMDTDADPNPSKPVPLRPAKA
jgi:hypothetical protein